MAAALVFKSLRAAQGANVSTALTEVALPTIMGLGVVIIPVIIIIKMGTKRYRQAMSQLQAQYPHVYYTVDFRYGQRLLVSDEQTVSIWRARRKGIKQETSWQRGAVSIKQATVPISKVVTASGIVFTDPLGKLRRLTVSDKVTARIEPLDYSDFFCFIQ